MHVAISCATCPMPDIAGSTVCCANCALRSATDSPIGDTVHHGLGETERERKNAKGFAYVGFGALVVTVDEPLGNGPWRVDCTVSLI